MWWPRRSCGDTPAMSRGAVRREARRIVAQMPLPRPFDLDVFITNIEGIRGRRIHLLGLPDHLLGGTGLCGLWIKHNQLPIDLIFHVSSTTGYHRERIILHELAHLWCGDADGITSEQLDTLLPEFPPELIGRLLGRGQVRARRWYDSPAEVRAEMIADILHDQAHLHDAGGDDTLRHLADDLTHPFARPRSTRTTRALV